jgi:hypothetical protein
MKAVVLLVLAVLLGAAQPSHAAEPQLEAQWVWTGAASERAAVDAAIERSIDGLFILVRAVARGRLRERSLIPQRYALSLRDELESSSTGNLPMRSPRDGKAVAYRSSLGEDVILQQHLDGGTLVQELVAEDGMRTNTFTLAPDGASMTLQVRLTSGRLSHPLEYALTYRRAP